jgi:hypothetical protein
MMGIPPLRGWDQQQQQYQQGQQNEQYQPEQQ